MKKILLVLTIALIVSNAYSQYLQDYYKIWYFGDYAGITFNTTPVSPLTDGAMITGEGCSCVGNATRLFFYTDGSQIWNRNHQVMPNGSGLLGHTSSSQCGLSVPLPGSYHTFYVFTTDANENDLANGLRYSIVDMTLDGSMGDVTSVKNQILSSSSTEKITVVPHANETDYWIIAHEWNSNHFLAYLLTSSGLNTTPVISAIGMTYVPGTPSGSGLTCGDAVGFIKASPDGNKIATVIHNKNKVEVYDFNRSTGVLSNLVTSPNMFSYPYGLEFSPNSKYMYVTTIYTFSSSKIYQFDLSQSNFFNSGVIVKESTTKEFNAMMLAPDAKIYIAEFSNTGRQYLSTIDEPDMPGTACQFNESSVSLSGRNSRRGLPNIYYYNPVSYNSEPVAGALKLNIYPNPLSSCNRIKIDGPEHGNAEFSLTDNSGRVIVNEELELSGEGLEYRLPELSKGIYHIRIMQLGKRFTGRICIE